MNLSADAIPWWVLLLLLWGVLHLAIIVTLPFLVLIHELGHAIPALFFGKKGLTVELGEGKQMGSWKLGHLRFTLRHTCWHRGRTTYEGSPESKLQAIAILGTAPLLSAALSLVALMHWWQSPPNLILQLLLAGAWLANTSIALKALNPWESKQGLHDPNRGSGTSTSSDLKDLVAFLRR